MWNWGRGGTEGFLVWNWGISVLNWGFLVLNWEILGAGKVWSLCGTDVLNWGDLCGAEGYSSTYYKAHWRNLKKHMYWAILVLGIKFIISISNYFGRFKIWKSLVFTCNIIYFFRYAPVGVFPGYPHPNSHHPYMPWTPHPAEHPIPAVFVHPGHPDYPHPHAQVDGHPSQGHSSHQGRAESVSSSDSGSSKKGSKVRKNII